MLNFKSHPFSYGAKWPLRMSGGPIFAFAGDMGGCMVVLKICNYSMKVVLKLVELD